MRFNFSLPIVLTLVGSGLILTGCSLKPQQLAQGLQQAYQVPSSTAQQVAPLILQHAEQKQVDPLLLAALIRQESHYRIQARSGSGAVGLTQVMPKYWQQRCPGDLYNPNINIGCGAMILNEYYQRTDSWPKALAYYNVGPTGYENSKAMQKQGKKYASSVKQHRKALKKAL